MELAVGAARKAYESWSNLPGHVRARHMYSIARHVQKHARSVRLHCSGLGVLGCMQGIVRVSVSEKAKQCTKVCLENRRGDVY